MAARIGSLGMLVLLGGCCLTVVSGSTGNYETGTGGLTTSGSTTGAGVATSTGGVFQYCRPAASLSDVSSYTSQATWRVLSADLNGDGLLDLVATEAPNPGIEVFFGHADGGLSVPAQYLEADGRAIAVGDLNGDGRPDVVTSNQSAIQIYSNDGFGSLSPLPPINLEGVGDIDDIAVADFNGDGLADLLVAEESNTGLQVVLLLAQSPGVFAAPGLIPGIGMNDGVTSTVVFLVSDLNVDGLPDIVANATDGSQLAVLLNTGDGGFASTLYPDASGQPTGRLTEGGRGTRSRVWNEVFSRR